MENKQKTVAETDLEVIREVLQYPGYEKKVAAEHEKNLKIFAGMNFIAAFDKKGKQYLDWILLQAENNFYIANIAYSGCVLLIKRPHLKSYLAIRYGYPGTQSETIVGKNRTIQIENIGSLKKGEGYKMMKKVIALARKMDVHIELWTETEENVKYFERYGFVNHGPLGDFGEFLMVLQNV